MRSMTSKLITVVSVASLALAAIPAVASAGNATLYELTENMKVMTGTTRRGKPSPEPRRVATAALTGVAAIKTPLCPDEKFASVPGGCAVNVTGMDNISLVTGFGTLAGTFTTVVQGDNPVDGPESVVLTGAFTGQMDFSPAIVNQIPYGTVVGHVASGKGKSAPFTGVFRLPFAGNVEVEAAPGYKLSLRTIFCPLSPTPNPYAPMYGGYDLAYLDFDAEGRPNGQCLDIQPTELSLGAPLVRFDVKF
jgi:hypothetical protein